MDAQNRLCSAELERSVKAWDQIFGQEGKVFTEPHEDMAAIAQLLKEAGASNILDLGSGTGRHVVYLARRGFSVYGLDNSSHGVAITKKWLDEEIAKLSAHPANLVRSVIVPGGIANHSPSEKENRRHEEILVPLQRLRTP